MLTVLTVSELHRNDGDKVYWMWHKVVKGLLHPRQRQHYTQGVRWQRLASAPVELQWNSARNATRKPLGRHRGAKVTC